MISIVGGDEAHNRAGFGSYRNSQQQKGVYGAHGVIYKIDRRGTIVPDYRLRIYALRIYNRCITREGTMHQEIVPISTNELGERFCDARELHGALAVGRDFSNWVRGRIEQYGFVEGEDYTQQRVFDSPDLANQKRGRGGDRRSVEYQLSLDMAKELAMLENNDMGKKVRRYFIRMENMMKERLLADAEERRIADLRRMDGRIKALERIAPAFSVKSGSTRYTAMGAYVEHSRHPIKHRKIRHLDMGHGTVHGYPLVVLYRDNQPYLRVDHAASIVGLSAKIIVRLGSDGRTIEFEGIKYVEASCLPEPVVEG